MEAPDIVQSFLVMIAAIQTIYYYKLLPPQIASHFTATGVANGSSAKSSFFILYWVMMGVAILISAVVPLLIGSLPASMINIPNKDYWLSDAKRDETVGILRAHMKWFGVALMAFLVACFQMVIHANLTPSRSLTNSFWVIIGAFAVVTIIWTFRLATRFSRVD